MKNVLLLLLAIVAGLVLPIQAGLNARMAKQIGHPIFATTVSFFVGTVALIAYSIAARLPTDQLKNYTQASWSEWIPGILGAFYVAATVILAPKLGAALTFALIIAGQMIISIILDHYGLIGLPIKALSTGRVIGIVLLIAGVILVRKF